jgi:hypothetical protein
MAFQNVYEKDLEMVEAVRTGSYANDGAVPGVTFV